MPNYVDEARVKYAQSHDKQELINSVWKGINDHARNAKVAVNATRNFVALTMTMGKDSWIDGKAILAQNPRYKRNRSWGLWPWLEEFTGADGKSLRGAGVVEVQGNFPDTKYRVKSEFYETLLRVVAGSPTSISS